MKYFIAVSILMTLCIPFLHAEDISAPEKDRIEIELRKEQNTGRDKSVSIVSVDAWIDNLSGQISIVASGLKDAYIYVYDANSNPVASGTAYFGEIESEYQLSAPVLPGRYWLIIDSPIIYAEGTFQVK